MVHSLLSDSGIHPFGVFVIPIRENRELASSNSTNYKLDPTVFSGLALRSLFGKVSVEFEALNHYC